MDDHNGTASHLLRLCLRGQWEPEAWQAARALAQRDGIDWEALCSLARAEGVSPLVYHVTRGRALLPAHVEQAFYQDYYRTSRDNALLMHELGLALGGLAAAGVEAIVLKGAALAETVYGGNIAVRPMCDLDLLVRPEQRAAALDTLAALGYQANYLETHPGDQLAHGHELTLHRPGQSRSLIDLHWGLLAPTHYQDKPPAGWLWATALPAHIGGVQAWVLGPEAQLLHLCAHRVLQHRDTRLLGLADIAQLIAFYQARLDWEGLLEQAQACELILALQQVLAQVIDGWHVPLPEGFTGRLFALRPGRGEERAFKWLTADKQRAVQLSWCDFLEQPGWRSRFQYAWRMLCPSPAYMRACYRVPHPVLLPLYYTHRWLVGLLGLARAMSRP